MPPLGRLAMFLLLSNVATPDPTRPSWRIRTETLGTSFNSFILHFIKYGDPRARPDLVGKFNPKPLGRPFNSFILHFIKFSFSKVPRPESLARPEGRVRIRARFTPTFSFILSKHLFMSFHFQVFNYVEAFSNGRPINIYISQNAITMKAFYAFLK